MSERGSGVSVNTQNLTIEEQANIFVKGLCSHIVCLTGTAFPLDENGRRCGSEIFFNFSGFVVSMYEGWMLVTAGHVLKQLDGQLLRREIELVHFRLADYFGLDVQSGVPIPFGYADCQKYAIDDEERGLDIGIIFLPPLYRRLLEANKIRAISQENWDWQQSLEWDLFGVLGFPEELFDRHKHISVSGSTVIGGVRPVLMFATVSDATPLNRPVPECPWLAVELRDKSEIKSIVGMSGGPIFGFKLRPGKPPLYTPIAVQSFWDRERRIAFGTRLHVVMGMLDQQLQALYAERFPGGDGQSNPE